MALCCFFCFCALTPPEGTPPLKNHRGCFFKNRTASPPKNHHSTYSRVVLPNFPIILSSSASTLINLLEKYFPFTTLPFNFTFQKGPKRFKFTFKVYKKQKSLISKSYFNQLPNQLLETEKYTISKTV